MTVKSLEILVLIITANVLWIVIASRLFSSKRFSPHILSNDPELYQLIYFTRLINNYEPDLNDKKTEGEVREQINHITQDLLNISTRYRNGKRRIERFISLGLSYIASSLSKYYVRGGERRFLSVLNKKGFITGIEKMVDSIYAQNVPEVYNSINDLVFIIIKGELPESQFKTLKEKNNYVEGLNKMFTQTIDSVDDPLDTSRDDLFTYLLKGVDEYKDSHLFSLYLVLKDYQKFLFGRRKEHKALQKFVKIWLNEWLTGDKLKEYDAFTKIQTIFQQVHPYIKPEAYIAK